MISKHKNYVLLMLAGQYFCIDAESIEDVVQLYDITPVPLAPSYIAGTFTARERIITAISLHQLLGLAATQPPRNLHRIIVKSGEHFYGLIADHVMEMVTINQNEVTPASDTLPKSWQEISEGMFSYQGKAVLIIDPKKLLDNLQE